MSEETLLALPVGSISIGPLAVTFGYGADGKQRIYGPSGDCTLSALHYGYAGIEALGVELPDPTAGYGRVFERQLARCGAFCFAYWPVQPKQEG